MNLEYGIRRRPGDGRASLNWYAPDDENKIARKLGVGCSKLTSQDPAVQVRVRRGFEMVAVVLLSRSYSVGRQGKSS